MWLQGPQEVQYFLLLSTVEVEELFFDEAGFTAVAGVILNGRDQIRRAAIV